jgi:hypothetical protein
MGVNPDNTERISALFFYSYLYSYKHLQHKGHTYFISICFNTD